jgi:glucose-6-phosphate isomerase
MTKLPRQNEFHSGLDIRLRRDALAFDYGAGTFGPSPEMRRLDDIRPSLRDPGCIGPDPVYGIAMDVGKVQHVEDLKRRHLLFGVVAYAAGSLGLEPVRSQGHVHAVAPHCGWSTPELFEIWQGKSIIYAQEFAEDEPGRCFATEAGVGEQVVIPPNWAHCVINADSQNPLFFIALCERQYGFVYDGVRAHGGLAWFPLLTPDGISWEPNPRYKISELQQRGTRSYSELGLRPELPVYVQYEQDADAVQWISEPALHKEVWESFEP